MHHSLQLKSQEILVIDIHSIDSTYIFTEFVKTVIYLIKKGCNIYCRNSHNHTFLQHIFRNPEIDEASKIDIIEAMLDIGADVNSFDIILSPFDKIPLLFSSLLNRKDKLFKILVNNGAKLTNDVYSSNR